MRLRANLAVAGVRLVKNDNAPGPNWWPEGGWLVGPDACFNPHGIFHSVNHSPTLAGVLRWWRAKASAHLAEVEMTAMVDDLCRSGDTGDLEGVLAWAKGYTSHIALPASMPGLPDAFFRLMAHHRQCDPFYVDEWTQLPDVILPRQWHALAIELWRNLTPASGMFVGHHIVRRIERGCRAALVQRLESLPEAVLPGRARTRL